jgi:hypothetical protein
MERRSFFHTLFGASTAAALPAPDLPEPDAVQSLRRGGIYAITWPTDYQFSDWGWDKTLEKLAREEKRLGVKFLALADGARICPPPQVNITINTVDDSVRDLFLNNSSAVAEAMRKAVREGAVKL